MNRPNRPRRHFTVSRPRVTLPPLTAEQAWAVAEVLERVIRTIWKTHGVGMADYQGRAWPDHPARQDDPSPTPEPPNDHTDEEIDF